MTKIWCHKCHQSSFPTTPKGSPPTQADVLHHLIHKCRARVNERLNEQYYRDRQNRLWYKRRADIERDFRQIAARTRNNPNAFTRLPGDSEQEAQAKRDADDAEKTWRESLRTEYGELSGVHADDQDDEDGYEEGGYRWGIPEEKGDEEGGDEEGDEEKGDEEEETQEENEADEDERQGAHNTSGANESGSFSTSPAMAAGTSDDPIEIADSAESGDEEEEEEEEEEEKREAGGGVWTVVNSDKYRIWR